MEENQDYSKNSNTGLKVGLALALALAALFGYLYFNATKTVEAKNIDIDSKTKELLITNSKLDSISNALDLKITEVELLGGEVTELQALKAQLERDKVRILNSKNVSIKEYQDKFAEYEAILARKDNDLAELREKNAALATTNETLNTTVSTLNVEKEGLLNEKEVLTQSVNEVTEKNKELSEKVTIAAALKPINFGVIAINKRGREREGSEFKARRLDQFKVSFKLVENPLTAKENKVVYMRLKDPQGNVVSDRATGSGAFKHNGKETIYTAKKTVNFTNTGQTVDFVYDKGSEYTEGKYELEFYSEGFKIGQTSFVVD